MTDNLRKVMMAMLSVQRYPWEQGVCMQAMYEAGEIQTAIAMAHDAVLRQKEDGRLAVINENIAVTDPAANGIVVKKAYEITKDSFYLNGAEKMLAYLMHKAPRTEKGILCHNEVSFHKNFSPYQIWADSIYMAPPFLAEMGEIQEAFHQIQGMYAYLVDEKTGLLRHIFDAGTNFFVRDKLWATGNGWALMGMEAVIETAMEKGFTEISAALFKQAQKLLDNILVFQLPDGRFHDILDDSSSFVDGASAMMVAAFIYRSQSKGFLAETYRKYADKISETMENFVDEYGIIHGVCGCPNFDSEGTSAESMATYIMMHSWKNK